ncbi:MAG: hypothetical protein IKS17_08705 [Firmicutes bacterium]|nr:hypothetical protein [Bacillota bacterium]
MRGIKAFFKREEILFTIAVIFTVFYLCGEKGYDFLITIPCGGGYHQK